MQWNTVEPFHTHWITVSSIVWHRPHSAIQLWTIRTNWWNTTSSTTWSTTCRRTPSCTIRRWEHTHRLHPSFDSYFKSISVDFRTSKNCTNCSAPSGIRSLSGSMVATTPMWRKAATSLNRKSVQKRKWISASSCYRTANPQCMDSCMRWTPLNRPYWRWRVSTSGYR